MRKLSVLFCLVLFVCLSAAAQQPSSRHFRFNYSFTVRNVTKGKPIQVWFPAASTNRYQTVRVISAKGDLPLKITREKEYGDSIYFASERAASKPEYHFEVLYDVVRSERVGYRDGRLQGQPVAARQSYLERFTSADRLVPISGRLADLGAEKTKGASTRIQKARAIYDYVFTTMRYDKSGTGWGRGDAEWACDSKHGNCTDFHSLFASMARSQGIPTRFAIGFQLPASKQSGEIPGYHCWADFYTDKRWIPVDISEASKAQEKKDYYFGSHDPNRIEFSIGRDLTLNPPQKGKPLNFFIYPYVEIDGTEFSNVRNEFSFEDVKPAQVATALEKKAER